ncbi:hypothetical protein, partial [Klebsiella pneumoniae]
VLPVSPQKRPETVLAVRTRDVMFNLIRTECFMERVLGIYVVGIIVSAGFLFIQEVRNGRRRSYTEEGASMLVGIICAFLWPLVLIAYFFDKKNGKL